MCGIKMLILKTLYRRMKQMFFCPVEEQIDLQSYLGEDLLHYRKAKLSSGCPITLQLLLIQRLNMMAK